MIRSVSHIALRVADVEEAEAYYCSLFALNVAFRDLQTADGQFSLRPEVTWAEAKAGGYSPGLSALGREGLFIALDQSSDAGSGSVDHIGLDVDADELAAQEMRNGALGCVAVAKRDDLLVFVDRYGLRWELTTKQYERLADQSTGARLGRWLELG